MEVKRRLVLMAISLVICATLFYSGRRADRKVTPAAFLYYTSGSEIIRLTGDVPEPGIYTFPADTRVGTVIKMTASPLAEKMADERSLNAVVRSGDIVDITAKDKQHVEIIIYKMKAKERILLGIPLVPDELDLADWESLPGIGPELAKEIMNNRQKYGGFDSFEALERVPGIGGIKLKTLKKYFRLS